MVGALEIAAGLAVLAGAALQSATGFGFALVSAPLVFAAAEPEQAVGLLILVGLIVNLMTLGTEGRRPQPLVRDSVIILAWGIPGVAVGVSSPEPGRLIGEWFGRVVRPGRSHPPRRAPDRGGSTLASGGLFGCPNPNG